MLAIAFFSLFVSVVAVCVSYVLVRLMAAHILKSMVAVGCIAFVVSLCYGLYLNRPAARHFERIATDVRHDVDRIPASQNIHAVAVNFTRQKSSVNLTVVPSMDTAIVKVAMVYRQVVGDTAFRPLITSANDFCCHAKTSAHYRGEAVDFRLKDVPKDSRASIADAVGTALGNRYFVLHEARGTENEHLHVQLRGNMARLLIDEVFFGFF